MDDITLKQYEKILINDLKNGKIDGVICDDRSSKYDEQRYTFGSINGIKNGRLIHFKFTDLIVHAFNIIDAIPPYGNNDKWVVICKFISSALINLGLLAANAKLIDETQSTIIRELWFADSKKDSSNQTALKELSLRTNMSEELVKEKCEELWKWEIIKENANGYRLNDYVLLI